MVKVSRRQELVEEFLRGIGMMVRGMDAIFRKEMERYEVTWPQFYLMKAVKRADGITVTELSNQMMITAPTASRMIDGLCSKGLLDKVKDTADHRVTRLNLTPKSRDLVQTLTAMQNRVMMEVFEGEETAELERTVDHLGRIAGRWLDLGEKTMKRSSGE
jgi:DNA-binding MarR family transcriptional regulator